MNLIDIYESGSNNILLWAIKNGADIKSDPAIQSVINDELSYIATIDEVNFFELFRLTQMYRDKLRIIDEAKAETPSRDELKSLFNGVYKPDDQSNEVELCEIVEHCSNMFINLTLQIMGNDTLIAPETLKLFLPMLSRKYIIQIPIGFSDVINSMNEDEVSQVYNINYPMTLDEMINNQDHSIHMAIQLFLLKSTSILKYDKQYDQYIKAIKHSPLKSCETDKFYKLSMIAFSKYDRNYKKNIRVDLFNINKDKLKSDLRRMAIIDSSLELEFAIQLPIQYMQMLENYFSFEILPIAYESSMSDIIDGGIDHTKFINTDEYNARFAEANQTLLNAIPIILNSNGDVDVRSTFAMMPAMYSTKAVIKVNMNNIDKLLDHYNDTIKEIFIEIKDIANNITKDIEDAAKELGNSNN